MLKEIYVNNTDCASVDANNTNKKVIFKNYTPFTDCIRKENNTQVDNAKDIDIIMQCITWHNIVIIIQKNLGAYGNIVKIYQL